jgi:DNA helicase-2/ATP-dependent DNA helicase PcrA
VTETAAADASAGPAQSDPGPADPDDVAIELFAGLPPVDVLLTAAAGCGKTEALAQRTAGLIRAGHVAPHQRILGVTFTNKARENLQSRIRRQLTLREQGLVMVRNFHGLAWRIIAAHGDIIGLDLATLTQPTKRDHAARQVAAGINGRNRNDVAATLRIAKSRGQTNEEVLAELEAAGDPIALAYERALQASGGIDFDDLLRLAGRILQNNDVAHGYQQHFAAVLVDEVQDLSVPQFEMVQLLGGDRVTYAGDSGQGIYTFAGAEPETIFADINGRATDSFELTRSFRSSPAVLAAVNALTALHGQVPLRCADPSKWGEDAVCSTESFATLSQEAAFITQHVTRLLTPGATVGVLARTGPRLATLRGALDASGVDYADWSAPLSDANTLTSLRRESRCRDSAGAALPRPAARS